MKTKAARKAMRHAKPIRKRTRSNKQSRTNAAKKTKQTFRRGTAEPESIELTEVAFGAPIELIDTDPEPVNDVIEIFEVAEDDDQRGW